MGTDPLWPPRSSEPTPGWHRLGSGDRDERGRHGRGAVGRMEPRRPRGNGPPASGRSAMGGASTAMGRRPGRRRPGRRRRGGCARRRMGTDPLWPPPNRPPNRLPSPRLPRFRKLPNPPATGTPPAPEPPLAALRRAESGVHGPLVVRAVRTHDLARAVPPEDAFVCLKLGDDTHPAVSLRACVPACRSPARPALVSRRSFPGARSDASASGSDGSPPDPAHSIAGHWLVDSLADGE